MSTYSIGDIVKINVNEIIYDGEIIGVSYDSFEDITYMIFVEELKNNAIGLKIEECDLIKFKVSDKFYENLNKRSFWKKHKSIIGPAINGAKCERCKEFNIYITSKTYRCWSCKQNPYR